MKKKIALIIFLILTISVILIYPKEKKEILDNSKENNNNNNNFISMMLENEKGKYIEDKNLNFPLDRYVFNPEKSGCENGGTLSWNEEKQKIEASLITSDKCYAYFDKGGGLKIIASNPHNLNANQAGMYRYQGSKDEVNNNYLCFGTFDKSECLENQDKYMYRILGITEDGLIKVIKNTSIGNYAWDSDEYHLYLWPSSSLFKELNGLSNPIFLNSNYIDKTWEEFIVEYNWPYGFKVGNIGEDLSNFLELEAEKRQERHAEKVTIDLKGTEGITCANIVAGINKGQEACYQNLYATWENIQAKIGLLSLVDIFWAVQKDGFNCGYTLSNTELSACTNSYLTLGDERIIVNGGYSVLTDVYGSWQVRPNGAPSWYNGYSIESPVRPVFYIKANILLNGNGSIEEPYIIKK